MRKLFFIGCLLLSSGSLVEAQTFVRHSTLCDNNTPTVTCSFSSNTAGDTIIIAGRCQTLTCAPTAADSAGNSYSRVVLCSGGTNHSFVVWEADNILASAGTNTITITTGSISTAIEGFEYSGLAASAFDKSTCNEGNSATLNSGNTATTAAANELVFSYLTSDGGVVTATDGTTTRSTDASNFNATWGDKNVTSTGVQASSGTVTSVAWLAGVATFKSASQPSGGTIVFTRTKALPNTTIFGGGAGSVSFDVAGAGTSNTGVSSLDVLHTVTNGIANAAIVALVGMASASNDVTGCTFNGTSMGTPIWNFRETQLGGYRTVGYILPVGTGDGVAHHAICSFTNTNGETALITESYSGVNQSTPNRAAFTAALSGGGVNGCNILGSVSLAVTNAVTGDMVIDLMSINHQTSLASSQTLVNSFLNIGGNNNSVLASRATATGSTNMGYTFPTSPEQCGSIGAVAIRP